MPRDIEEYMSFPYSVQVAPVPEGGYVAEMPEFRSMTAKGATIEEAMANMKVVFRSYLENALKNGDKIFEPPKKVMEFTAGR